jgi:hypothetical protein
MFVFYFFFAVIIVESFPFLLFRFQIQTQIYRTQLDVTNRDGLSTYPFCIPGPIRWFLIGFQRTRSIDAGTYVYAVLNSGCIFQ